MADPETKEQTSEQAQALAITYAKGVLEKIENDGELQIAGEQVKQLTRRRKDLKEFRLRLTRPIDESKKNIMDEFRPAEEATKEAEDQLREIVLSYQQKQEEERRRALFDAEQVRKREDEAASEREAERQRVISERAASEEAGEIPMEPEPAEPSFADVIVTDSPPATVDTPKSKVKGISTTKRTTWEVTDFAKLPDSFKLPDRSKIQNIVRTMGKDTDIPGVTISTKEGLNVRA